jgi:shikimate kinase
MKNYFFCGIKHSGKTTHAKIYANAIDIPAYDADDLILEMINGYTIREYYREFGKQAFLSKEYSAINKFLTGNTDDKVLSLGGGVCDNDDTMNLLKNNGIIIFIRVDEETLYKRIVRDDIPPFLEGSPREKFHDLFINREEKYLKYSDIVIEVQDAPISETAQIIRAEIGKWQKNGTQ